MKISIITVVYNNEKTIKDAIESVLSQSYPYIEYIIIDGNSNDLTNQIINNYKRKLGFYVSEKDSGIYDAMNKGIKAAKGEVVGILNSDDLYENDKVIDTVMSQFLSDPSLDVVYGDLVYVKRDNVQKVIRKWRSKPYHERFFEDGNVPPHPSFFVKRQVYEKVGYFNLNFNLAADYEFMLRVAKNFDFKLKYLNKVIVKMRLGGATNKSFLNIFKQNIEILNAWKQNNLKPPFLLMPKRIIKRVLQFI